MIEGGTEDRPLFTGIELTIAVVLERLLFKNVLTISVDLEEKLFVINVLES